MFTHNLDASDSKYELDHFHTITVNVGREAFPEVCQSNSACRKSKIPQWPEIRTFIITQVD